MSKNVRISLYILIPIIVWMISGQFVDDSAPQIKENNSLTSVVIKKSTAAFFAPKITSVSYTHLTLPTTPYV